MPPLHRTTDVFRQLWIEKLPNGHRFREFRPRLTASRHSGYEETLVAPALAQALGTLKQQATDAGGQDELHASVAEGTDTLCVETARLLTIPVHLLLPLPEKKFENDFSGPAAWERAKT